MDGNTRSLITEMHKFSNLCNKIDDDNGLIYSDKKYFIIIGKLLSTKKWISI